ncbi:signal transduction histidine kinase [Azospirillum lipoferum]|uniref:histidine kinase n=1 Tax=Azospirillum lipoferum TaxID=193 RepID=A0A5A9GHY6_AZOLI|nr:MULTISPECIES: HAMP domain-containing sensor histidine kinase [Azospirillum]KAA0593956.1 HAMP domain-containing histidine kinase [Azospirillum lipoferum]MCP1612431.1 signal transduction histidine kinase [Azospirillum lipoferum]MDW5531785.1 HAMP domain-containing sensor histidine kinase [Azospirillum sp. NL1]
MTMRSQEQELRQWVQRLAEDPANAGNPLLAEFQMLAERHGKLLRQFRKIAKISDRLQTETKEMARQQRQFVLMVSHEFRTPLAIIDSASQLLELEPKLPVSAMPRVGKIRNAVQRMLHLIERCLTHDRLGAAAARPTAFDLAAMLTTLVCEMAAAVSSHRIELHGADRPVPIPGDRDLLAVVFSNLLENAVKYSPNGGTIRLDLLTGGEAGEGQVTVRITDEGIGVNAADAARLFDKYFRASNAAGTTGAGLGLHLARCIVDTHGGGISVASEPGRGSAFTVRLPVARATAPAVVRVEAVPVTETSS